jgi:hypothetical protein
MIDNELLDVTPDAQDLWAGIGGHFDTICQILCEFIDNSISNYIANDILDRSIYISIEDLNERGVKFTIEDKGTGIKNLTKAFTLGNRDCSETPLNEHGFGFKHALASANPANDSWSVATRTIDDFNNNVYKQISYKYVIKDLPASTNPNWIGKFGTHGTIISFTCSQDLYKTTTKGLSGPSPDFDKTNDVLKEDLGFIYAGVIDKENISIHLFTTDTDGKEKRHRVIPITPSWKSFVENIGQGKDQIDLGGGTITIEYSFGLINSKEDTHKYYKTNMSSSGAEIRINGRLLSYNIFKEIWRIEKHNTYNGFFAQINLISDLASSLPKTRTSKNGIREGDPKLEKLYAWIYKLIKIPPNEGIKYAKHETELFKELKKLKIAHMSGTNTIETEQPVYSTIDGKVRVDLYVFESDRDYLTIYEGKRKETEPQDAYQLLMYWDGCVHDGLKPNLGILIASEHPESVKKIISILNERTDSNNNPYNFKLKTWHDERINYPQIMPAED